MGGANPFLELAAPPVRSLAPYVPGKPIDELERELGLRDVVKLASNENPLGAGAAARRALAAALDEVGLYPDGSGHALKQALARRHGVAAECITLGNGSNDLLVLLAEAFLTPGHAAVYSQYCFAVYPIAVQATGATAQVARALPPEAPMPLGHDLEALAACVDARTRLVFVANPNNPTGTWLAERELRAFVAGLPSHVLAVVDEAYFEYARDRCPDASTWLAELPNLVVLRTFSKAHGLAGVRVGYALSDPGVADLLNRVRQPFNVTSLGLAAAAAALGDDEHVRRSVESNRAGLVQVAAGLDALGLAHLPSAGNFVLVDCGREARPVYEAMLRAGVIVRPVGNYGLPRHLRFTIGTPAQNERLLAALAAAVRGAGA